MKIIARVAIAVYDGSPASPIRPARPDKPDDAAGEYLAQTADKLAFSDGSRKTALAQGSAQQELVSRFATAPFMEAADALFAFADDALQSLEIPREGFDLAVFTYEEDGAPHVCVAYLPYRAAMAHRVIEEDGGVKTGVARLNGALPQPGAKGCAGFVANLSTGEIRLRDTAVLTNVGNRQLFGEALFAMEPSHTAKQAVQAVTEAIEQAAPPDMPPQELRPAVKRAMAKSIEEKGVIDVQNVAEEVFRSDPEREAIIEQVSRQLAQEAVAPQIPVEDKRVERQLSRVKIRTDNGVSITMPRQLADDENSFAVVENSDGTISIIISRVQELRTE